MTYQDTLKAIYDDPHIWAQDDRAAVTQACLTALHRTGQLHIKEVRAILRENKDTPAPHRIGANVQGVARRLRLVVVGRAPSGGPSGNQNKSSPIWARPAKDQAA